MLDATHLRHQRRLLQRDRGAGNRDEWPRLPRGDQQRSGDLRGYRLRHKLILCGGWCAFSRVGYFGPSHMHFSSFTIADGEPGQRAKHHHATQPGDNNSEGLRIESGIFQSHQSKRICMNSRSLIKLCAPTQRGTTYCDTVNLL